MSECRWSRPTELVASLLYHTDDIPAQHPLGTPCGGAECEDRRRRNRSGCFVCGAPIQPGPSAGTSGICSRNDIHECADRRQPTCWQGDGRSFPKPVAAPGLVERLLNPGWLIDINDRRDVKRLCKEAADEIERLRGALQEVHPSLLKLAQEAWPEGDLYLHGSKVRGRTIPASTLRRLREAEREVSEALNPKEQP